MSRDDSCTIRIIRFHEKHYRRICKISKKNREKPAGIKSFDEFRVLLSQTMHLWHGNALNLVKGEEHAFLISMMSDRVATYSPFKDAKAITAAKKRKNRQDISDVYS